MTAKEHKRGKIRMVFTFIVALNVIGMCAGLSFLFWSSIIKEGEPFLIAALSGMTGFMIFGSIMMLFSFITRGRKKNDLYESHRNMLEAIQEIASGNFDVLIQHDPNAPHQEMAEAFNRMARDLGSIETMRQDFISNVSHEIQSPLTSMSGFASLLQKDNLPNDERQRYAVIIEAESKRLSSLSDNLLKLSSLDNNKIPLNNQDFRLDKQLEHIALTLEPQWSAKNLTVEADLQKLTVHGDEELISQAWINLLHNAIKFTQEGGQINISLTCVGELATIKISDTGVGITPQDQIHIFERFYKADKARDRSLGGNGLGLCIAQKIVGLHGGSITVDSKIDKGTVFTTTLPLCF